MPSEAQKERARKLREQIDELIDGEDAPPRTPREMAERAAAEAKRKAERKRDGSPREDDDTEATDET